MADKQYYVPGNDYRYGGAAAQIPKLEDDLGHAGPPPPPGSGQFIPAQQTVVSYPWYHPRGWSLRTKLIIAAAAVVIIVAVIVGAVEGTKKPKYPNYSRLDYKLVDTYSGASFFDRFDYYSGEDPTDGFVQYGQSFPQLPI